MPSLLAPPAAVLPTPTLLTQWLALFRRGLTLMPGLGIATAAAYGAVAYSASGGGGGNGAWVPYAVAGALVVAVIPYTLVVMRSTNARLIAAATTMAAASTTTGSAEGAALLNKPAAALSDPEARALILRWSNLNFGRGLLPLAGAAVALWTLLG